MLFCCSAMVRIGSRVVLFWCLAVVWIGSLVVLLFRCGVDRLTYCSGVQPWCG